MSLGLVAYADSDDSDDESVRPTKPPATSANPPPQVATQFKRPPPPLFPGSTRGPPQAPQRAPAAYSDLAVGRDERGRALITAPRLEYAEEDEDEEDGSRRAKRVRQNERASGVDGLFAMLPQPKSDHRKQAESAKVAAFDQMFARKRTDAGTQGKSSTQTVQVPSASTMRYEAELKKAQMLQKFMKREKPPPRVPVSHRSWPGAGDDDGDEEGSAQAPPGEPDYFGLTPRSMDDLQYPNKEVTWEVDESAYEDQDEFESDEPVQPAPIVWTANYKYEDVQGILEHNAQMQMAAPSVPGYRTDKQVEKLIARYEGPEFQEYLSMGNSLDIVDFRADDHLGNARENVMKALTEQEANPPPRPVAVKGKVNRTAKQKGQITYLAAQAVARESELQNQWARNRSTRQQTSMKYGF